MTPDYRPRVDTQFALLEHPFGRCLNIGTGSGFSARIMQSCQSVVSVTTMDALEAYQDPGDPAIEVVAYDPYVDRDFDFVFIDDFSDRWEVAKYWHDRGSVVLMDDARLVPQMINGLNTTGLEYEILGDDKYSPALIRRAA